LPSACPAPRPASAFLQAACIIRGLAHEQDGEAQVTGPLLGPTPAGRVPPDSA
jgi:hypothetical protein